MPRRSGAPLRKLGVARRASLGAALREVKVLVPICVSDEDTGFQGCQDSPGHSGDWYLSCHAKGHNPYFSIKRIVRRIPQYADPDPDRPGVKVIAGYVEEVTEEALPNLRQLHVGARAGFHAPVGDVLAKKRMWGWILPEEHPVDPLAPFCEYRDCWSQDLTVRTEGYGNYCCIEQARGIVMDEDEIFPEVFHDKKMRKILNQVQVPRAEPEAV